MRPALLGVPRVSQTCKDLLATRATVSKSRLKRNCWTAKRKGSCLKFLTIFFHISCILDFYWAKICTPSLSISIAVGILSVWHGCLCCLGLARFYYRKANCVPICVVTLNCPPEPVNHSCIFHLYAFHYHSGCFHKEAYSLWSFCLDNILKHLCYSVHQLFIFVHS